ncbi:hypothetical protein Tco_1434690, partial [Tanacetum coccineum]
EGKENGKLITKSIMEGPYVLERVKVTENGVDTFRDKTEDDLNPTNIKRMQIDIWAANIILQGLPMKIFALLNQHKVVKGIWDTIKLIMEGSKLTRPEKEEKLYD